MYGRSLRKEIDGVGELERSLREASGEVAFLVADADEDGVSLLGQPAAFRRLEVDRALEARAFGKQDDAVPRVPLGPQVALGGFAKAGRPPADEEDRDPQAACVADEIQRGGKGLRLRHRLSGAE